MAELSPFSFYKYHVVIVPKFRKKAMFTVLGNEIEDTLGTKG